MGQSLGVPLTYSKQHKFQFQDAKGVAEEKAVWKASKLSQEPKKTPAESQSSSQALQQPLQPIQPSPQTADTQQQACPNLFPSEEQQEPLSLVKNRQPIAVCITRVHITPGRNQTPRSYFLPSCSIKADQASEHRARERRDQSQGRTKAMGSNGNQISRQLGCR